VGQIRAAALMRALLEDSAIRESHRENDPRVQDAYSLRCAPQVLGAVADAIEFAHQTVAVELNASTDNPLVFENGDVISGGNFHGQPVAQALDILAMTLTTLQAIAERRIERLVNPDLSQGLPAFLTKEPGLSSGLMMVQIAAASLVAESRALAMPASIGSIPTDANQEDFVPMGMAAAFKAGRILTNAQRVVAAELLCAAQGLEFLKPLTPGRGVGELYRKIRSLDPPIAPLSEDRPPGPDLERLAAAVAHGEFDPGSPAGEDTGA
jgi:histidine ammonia-lyase